MKCSVLCCFVAVLAVFMCGVIGRSAVGAEQTKSKVNQSIGVGDSDWASAQLSDGQVSDRSAPIIDDYFQNFPLQRWSTLDGNWEVKETVDIYHVETSDIYQSPEEPSWVEWVGLWQLQDESIMVGCAQITGNPGLEPSYRPWYGGAWYLDQTNITWEDFLGGMRPGPEDALSSTKMENALLRSRDLGQSWQKLKSDHPVEHLVLQREGKEPSSRVQLRVGGNLRFGLAKDGTLVATGGPVICCRNGRLVSITADHGFKKGYLLGVRESVDNGKTWLPIQYLLPEGSDPKIISGLTSEYDLVELDDGRILVVIRGHRPIQTYLTRVGPGQYEASPPTSTPMPHSGMPSLIRGSDGVIWYWGHGGHWYTIDSGQSWQRSPLIFPSYYGKMRMTGPREVLCVTQHLIHDSPYPYGMDSSIRKYHFSYRRSGIFRQTADNRPLALAIRADHDLADLHIRADVRVDGANGIAFHVQPDGKSYYIMAVVVPGNVYDLWFPPEIEKKKLDMPHAGEEESRRFALGDPMCVLGRVEDGRLTVLTARKMMDSVKKGDWVQIQVKVTGDLLQGAARRDRVATYVGVHDSHHKSGSTGLITDRSVGSFQKLYIWDTPHMMRDLWQQAPSQVPSL